MILLSNTENNVTVKTIKTKPLKPRKARTHRPHWYLITYSDCPVCGRSETYRERKYTPKPILEKRYEHMTMNCNCIY
jgi:hypothetical protein